MCRYTSRCWLKYLPSAYDLSCGPGHAYMCVYILLESDPPKRGSYCHPLQPPDSLSVFSEQCWDRAVRELLFRTDRNAFAPPPPRHWLRRAAKPRPLSYKYAMRSWNSSYPLSSPRSLERTEVGQEDGDIVCHPRALFCSFNGRFRYTI